MGNGAFIHITNKTKQGQLMRVSVTAHHCMNATGNWDDLLPYNSSADNYIEAKASGSCAFSTSEFGLKFSILDTTTGNFDTIGTIMLKEKNNTWRISNNSPNVHLAREYEDKQFHFWFDISEPMTLETAQNGDAAAAQNNS